MKLKGKTIIELKDTRSGRVDRFEDHNTVMDANIEAKFRNFGIFQTSVLNNFASTPLWQKLMGGILLLGDTVDANANFIAPGTKQIARGYYGGVNNGSPVSLGSWNSSESAVSANSVQMVYDWTTSQGNGEIKSVCLTSDYAGRCGLGNTAGDYNTSYSVDSSSWQGYNKNYSSLTNLTSGHAFDGTYIYYNPVVDGTSLTISKKYANALKVDLIHRLEDSNTAGTISLTLASAMAHDDNLRLVQASATRLILIGYDAESATAFSTVDIDLSANPVTATVREISSMPALDSYETYGYGRIESIGGDWLAVPTNAYKPKSFAVKITDGSKVSFVDSTNTYQTWISGNYTRGNFIQVLDNGLFIMATNQIAIPGCMCDRSDGSMNYCENYINNGPLRAYNGMNLIGQDADYNIRIKQNPFYLATINNLSTSVTKTSAQTMKVTYVITRA